MNQKIILKLLIKLTLISYLTLIIYVYFYFPYIQLKYRELGLSAPDMPINLLWLASPTALLLFFLIKPKLIPFFTVFLKRFYAIFRK